MGLAPILSDGELEKDGGQDLSPEVDVLRINGPMKSSVGNEDAAPLRGAILQVKRNRCHTCELGWRREALNLLFPNPMIESSLLSPLKLL